MLGADDRQLYLAARPAPVLFQDVPHASKDQFLRGAPFARGPARGGEWADCMRGGMRLWSREAGEGGGLVVEAGDDFAEVERVEDEEDVAMRAEETEAPVAGAKGGEGADDGAEAGAIELDDVFEVQDDAARAGVDEIAEKRAQFVVGAADGGLALKVEDDDVAGTTGCDLQAQGALLGERWGPSRIIRGLGKIERGRRDFFEGRERKGEFQS